MRRFLVPAALAVLTLAPSAHAFCRSTTCKGDCAVDDAGCPSTGKPLFWKGKCVGVSFQRDYTRKLPKADVKAALERSLFAWTGVACPGGGQASIAFSELDEVACKRSTYSTEGPNVNVVLLQDDDFPYKGIDNTLGKTTVTFDADTGEILDADIELNSAFNELTVSDTKVVYDLESIMTHELGHLLGLAHSDDANATMNPAYDMGSTGFRSLGTDDVSALCAVYPPTRTASCDPTPRGGLSATCDAAAEDDSGGGLCATRAPSRGDALAGALGLFALALWARRGRWCTTRG